MRQTSLLASPSCHRDARAGGCKLFEVLQLGMGRGAWIANACPLVLHGCSFVKSPRHFRAFPVQPSGRSEHLGVCVCAPKACRKLAVHLRVEGRDVDKTGMHGSGASHSGRRSSCVNSAQARAFKPKRFAVTSTPNLAAREISCHRRLRKPCQRCALSLSAMEEEVLQKILHLWSFGA